MAEPLSLKELAVTNLFNVLENLSKLPSSVSSSTQRFRDYFENLPIVMLKSVRKEFIALLNSKVKLKVAATGPPMDYCTILEGIVDKSLEFLHINTPLPTRASFTKLMWVIASRCPQLKELSITFFNNNAGVKLAVTPELIPILRPRSLENLDYLRLCSPEDQQGKFVLPSLESVLGIIGQTCPNLDYLNMSDFCNREKRSILALLMGEDLARALFPLEGRGWMEDLDKLRIPTKYLSPICFALKELDVLKLPSYGAEYVFALRHLPKMLQWNHNCTRHTVDIPPDLIFALFRADQEEELHSELQEAFEEQCRLFALALKLNVPESSEKFSGPLSITKIAAVSVRQLDGLEAIGVMCPLLDSIHFGDPNTDDSPSLQKNFFEVFWSMTQLTYIKLSRVHPDLIKIIIDAFGFGLKALCLRNCGQIDLTDLWQCTQLERLYVTNSTINMETSDPVTRTSSAFLPKLKQIGCCAASLPAWSSWFQSKFD